MMHVGRNRHSRALATALAGLGSTLSAIPALGQGFGDHDWMWRAGGGWDHMIFGGLMMLVFWGAIVVLIVLAFRWLGGSHGAAHPGMPHRTPLDILKERYARGEIDKEEFLERRRHLSE
jgi:putative membrane protein